MPTLQVHIRPRQEGGRPVDCFRRLLDPIETGAGAEIEASLSTQGPKIGVIVLVPRANGNTKMVDRKFPRKTQ